MLCPIRQILSAAVERGSELTPEQMELSVAEFVRAAKENGHIDLTLRRQTAAAIVASLQLAIRHPGFVSSPTSITALRFVEMLIEACSTGDNGQDYPLVRQMLNAGFDPDQDWPN